MSDGNKTPSGVTKAVTKMAFGTWERSPTIAIFAAIVGACLWYVYICSREDRVEMQRANAETITILKTVVQDCTKSHESLSKELSYHRRERSQ